MITVNKIKKNKHNKSIHRKVHMVGEKAEGRHLIKASL